MLYIIGGTTRSGKTLFSQKAISERGISYFPLDALFRALAKGAPELGIIKDGPLMERPIKMWPVTKNLSTYFLRGQDFLIEGDSILPNQVNELIVEHNSIKSCFFGFAETTKEEKFTKIREHHQGNLDWTTEISDEEMLTMISEMIDFSKYIREECFKYNIKYFDVSHDFNVSHKKSI